ncbi:MAG: AI-2E family transporter, partial [Planctomycetaceae bacterium]|nr:AI-2E family transporter [Planctomycetaceae bacterium]
LAGLLVYSLIHAIARRFEGRMLTHHRAKWVALSLIAAVIIGAATLFVLLILAFLHGRLGNLQTLLDRMAAIIESARNRMGWQSWIPATEELKDLLSHALRGHAGELERRGGELGRGLVHALVGIVIGALAAFDTGLRTAPLARALQERLRRLSEAFERIVFAQIRISFLNTVFTGLYLLVALPLAGIELPLRKTLVLLTFVVGLLPVLGNLLSNAAIVVISLGVSFPVAISSLVFLVVIHKLEYFLNARIVGRSIRAASWEILVAMVAFEAIFGLPGVIAAPIVYAYVKGELVDRGLV